MDLIEGVGESSSPPRSFGCFGVYDVRNDVYNRLMESGNEEAVSNPEFREQLDAHFNRLPPRYHIHSLNLISLFSSFLFVILLLLGILKGNPPAKF